MTDDELFSLPVAMQVRALVGCLDGNAMAALRNMAKPKPPLPPKFDQAIFRSGGVMFASETDLEGLTYWHKKYLEGVAAGGEYADRDRKRASSLERWINWRKCYPDACWSGERDDKPTVAKPPSSKPTVYARNGGNRPPPPPEEDLSASDDDIPW